MSWIGSRRCNWQASVLCIVASAWFGVLDVALAHEALLDAVDVPFSTAEQHRPTPLPDRVVLTWADDPATSMHVTWRTSSDVDEPKIQYAVAASLRGNLATGEVPMAAERFGATSRFESDLGVHLNHSAELAGLQPATMYVYRVGDGNYWSEWFQFRTASQSAAPFTFVYFGDAQNAVRSLWSRVVREANQHAPRAAFMLHAGDLINRRRQDAEWGEWFGAGGWLNGMIPSIATPGNHEYGDGALTAHWRAQFAFPLNGPEGLEETVYWIDYQGARIISLNSNERIEEQATWLTKTLADTSRPKWTIVTFHHPIFSAAKDRDNPEIRAAWRPILEENGVDLVLQGHDHAYNRSGLGGPADAKRIDAKQPVAKLPTSVNVAAGVTQRSSNTVYVVSVSGPKMYGLQENAKLSRVASGVQLFQVIHVAPDAIAYEARLATGELYDAFTLKKDARGASTLVEQIPNTAEIRD